MNAFSFIIEKYGSGIGRVLDEFEEIGKGFRATVFKEPINSDRVSDNASTYNEKDTIKDTIKSREKENILLQKIKQNPSITSEELAETLNINLRNTKKYLAKLKEQGKLKRLGGRKHGTWQVIEE